MRQEQGAANLGVCFAKAWGSIATIAKPRNGCAVPPRALRRRMPAEGRGGLPTSRKRAPGLHAADAGITHAQVVLGEMVVNGRGGPADLRRFRCSRTRRRKAIAAQRSRLARKAMAMVCRATGTARRSGSARRHGHAQLMFGRHLAAVQRASMRWRKRGCGWSARLRRDFSMQNPTLQNSLRLRP